MLEYQRKSLLRRKITERGFEVNIRVPLGLVERKQQPRYSKDKKLKLEEIYQLEEEAIAKNYAHDEFLQEVIWQIPASHNKHLAIVGEPGAGKTTLLDSISDFITSQTEHLPIFISLASLQGKTLEDYLLKTWLDDGIRLVYPQIKITSEIEQQLIARFSQGGVWLLLDGLDEMGFSSAVSALKTMETQLTSWLKQARVVLTCRVNVWDASINNPLNGFDTYKTQEFQPEQIEQFIQDWFLAAKLPQRGEQLQAKLRETGRENIHLLVKSPLQLALLCQIFYLNKEGELPKTKAVLYQRFTSYFYEWKHQEIENKNLLHSSLAKLALAGINSTARYRLTETLARREMGDNLFKLACNVGWLNLVNRDRETDEAVYAFFHPTFQEYFAACGIPDWDYFLPRRHKNKPVFITSIPPSAEGRSIRRQILGFKLDVIARMLRPYLQFMNFAPSSATKSPANYRIFAPQWKEVILLWLGREDVEKEEKDEFIQALVEFNDGCKGFYWCQSYLLAAAGIGEFNDYSKADEIVNKIIKWSFNSSMAKEAKAALQQTDCTKASAALVELIQTSQDEDTRREAAEILGIIDLNNSTAINSLVELFQISEDKYIRRQAAISLGKVGKNNYNVIKSLVESIKQAHDRDKYTLYISAGILGEIGKNNQVVIAELVELFQSCNDENLRHILAYYLGEIGKNDLIIINKLIELTNKSIDQNICLLSVDILGKISQYNSTALPALVELIQTTDDKYTREIAVLILGTLSKENPVAVRALVELSRTSDDKYTCKIAAHLLGKIGKDNLERKDNPKIIDNLIESIQTSPDDYTRFLAAKRLEKIGKDNLTAITALVELIKTSHDEYTRFMVAKILGEIANHNPTAISHLEELIKTSEDEDIRRLAAYTLIKNNQDNPAAIHDLVKSIQTSQDEVIRWRSAESLKNILPNNQMAEVVTKLKPYLNNSYNIIWHCAQNMSYPDFYQAYHQESGAIFNSLTAYLRSWF